MESAGSEAFDRILLEAVDEGLQMILGKNMERVIYHWLERNHSLVMDEIPQRLEDFHSSLEGLFGFGAAVIERQILERLFSELGLKYQVKRGYSFADYVMDARKTYKMGDQADLQSGNRLNLIRISKNGDR
ncbi:MAG: hypothetical protein ACE5Z5_03100 [Candidatus Bathyarchaeia archaeon]